STGTKKGWRIRARNRSWRTHPNPLQTLDPVRQSAFFRRERGLGSANGILDEIGRSHWMSRARRAWGKVGGRRALPVLGAWSILSPFSVSMFSETIYAPQ